MVVRFYIDPDSEEPHIYGHGIIEEEVIKVLRGAGEDLPAFLPGGPFPVEGAAGHRPGARDRQTPGPAPRRPGGGRERNGPRQHVSSLPACLLTLAPATAPA